MPKIRFKLLIWIFLFLVYSFRSEGQQLPKCIKSGIYEGILYLAYDSSSKIVSGYVDYSPYKEDKSNVQIRCKIFFLGKVGKYNDNKMNLYQITDTITVHKLFLSFHSDNVNLKLADNLPSCESIIDLNPVDGGNLSLSKQKQFKRFSVIGNKTEIYIHPDSRFKSNKYFVKGDIVNIIKKANQWVLVEFYGSKTTIGWIKKDSFLKFQNSP